MEELLVTGSRILIWVITLVIPFFGWFLKRMIRQIDERFTQIENEDKLIKLELDGVKLKVNDACKSQEEIKKIWEWISEHQKWGFSENDKRKDQLVDLMERSIETNMNVKNLCEHFKVPYIKKNGN